MKRGELKSMKLFKNLFKENNEITLASPVDGKLVSIKTVSDPTFSEEIIGKSVAIMPSEGKFYSPADGTVSTVFHTGHAVAITTDEGAEIMIHIGLDTVKLNGEHFHAIASEGQKVKTGDLLIEADLESIKMKGYDIVTPVIICNSDKFSEILPVTEKEVAKGDHICIIRGKKV